MFPAILFDFNGVLVDDETVHLEAFRDALRPLGVSISTDDYVERYLGYDDRGAFRAILTDAGRPPSDEQIAELIAAKKPLYLRRAERELRTFPGAAEAVRRAARLGPVAVVSGALRDEIALGLGVLGVAELVEHVVSAEDTRACKPDPEGYELALEYLAKRLDAERARRAVVIEDSLAGIEAAKGAGLACVAVSHSYPRETLLGSRADLVVGGLDEITEERLLEVYDRVHG